ncbi:MAG: hypothetical protein ACE5IL_13770 [Myxococcota bacterium]
MSTPTFEEVWARICEQEQEFFRTRLGRWFRYRIEGRDLCPSQTQLRIPRSDFELAFPLLPLPTPGKLNRLVTGAGYLWAILHDPRISRGAW